MPQTTSAAMRNALYVRFGLFAAFVLDSLRGVGGRERFESSNVAFAAQAVGLRRCARRAPSRIRTCACAMAG